MTELRVSEWAPLAEPKVTAEPTVSELGFSSVRHLESAPWTPRLMIL